MMLDTPPNVFYYLIIVRIIRRVYVYRRKKYATDVKLIK